jgi:hypothetical protein
MTERQSDNNAPKLGVMVLLCPIVILERRLLASLQEIRYLISYRWNPAAKCFLLEQNYIFCAVEGLISSHSAMQQTILHPFLPNS